MIKALTIVIVILVLSLGLRAVTNRAEAKKADEAEKKFFQHTPKKLKGIGYTCC